MRTLVVIAWSITIVSLVPCVKNTMNLNTMDLTWSLNELENLVWDRKQLQEKKILNGCQRMQNYGDAANRILKRNMIRLLQKLTRDMLEKQGRQIQTCLS